MNKVIQIIKEKYPLFSAEDLIEEFFWTEEQVKSLILQLKKEKRIVVLYKLKTEERFLTFDNDWTPHLQDLCKIFVSTRGNSIDGSEIQNIDFKFKLLPSSEES